MFSREEIAEYRMVRAERVTATRGVCVTPCLLFHAVIASNGGGDADAQLYDGHGLASPQLFGLYCLDEMSVPFAWWPPVYFGTGLYVVVGTNCEAVTVHYKPL